MKKNVYALLRQLQAELFIYQPQVNLEKINMLKAIASAQLPYKNLDEYHECLLFMSAYSSSPKLSKLTQQELNRIALFMKALPETKRANFDDSGLPYTKMITRFSCDILLVMLYQFKCSIAIDSFEEDGVSLNTLLNITLPKVLKQETTAGLDNLTLLDALGVKQKERLSFLLNEFKKLEDKPLVKDHLWESLKIYLTIDSNSKYYSRSFNRIDVNKLFYHDELLKKFDAMEVILKPLPASVKHSEASLNLVIEVIQKSLLLTMRETDTATYMEPSSLQLFHLERGVSIALYNLKWNRQLPYQSYIGYTAFKNGYPVAYGGSWLFGSGAMFGLNILETYRGGESGYLMCQLLRVYVQRYQLSYVEVENYQFGKDNPDGIKSGAFWFYYRFGFRPIDNKLNLLAEKEFHKIKNQKHYRTSDKTLIALSESNIALNITKEIPIKKEVVFNKVLGMISKDFGGDNIRAVEKAVKDFKLKMALEQTFQESEIQTLEEVALWASAFKVQDSNKLKLLYKMIAIKSVDAFQYNELIKQFFAN